MYLSLEAKYTVNGKPHGRHTSMTCQSLDDAISKIKTRILQEHPTAKNIVITEEPKNEGKPLLIDELVRLVKKERPDLDDKELRACEFMLLTDPGRDRECICP